MSIDKTFGERLAKAIQMADIYNCGCYDCAKFEAEQYLNIIMTHDWDTEAKIDSFQLPRDTPLKCSCIFHPNPLWTESGHRPAGWRKPRVDMSGVSYERHGSWRNGLL